MARRSRSWLKVLFFNSQNTRGSSRDRVVLKLNQIDERLAPAVIAVTSVEDNVDPVVTVGHAGTANDPYVAPSLRSAITFANATANQNNQPDEIRFDIGDGQQVITVMGSALPTITDALVINGAWQPEGTNQKVILDGSHKGFPRNPQNDVDRVSGLTVQTKGASSANGSRIWGITIRSFTGDGVVLDSVSDVHVGGSGERQGNGLISNAWNGVRLTRPGGSESTVTLENNHVVGNLIEFNGTGVLIYNSTNKNYIGGSKQSERNVIVYNSADGIDINTAPKTVVFNNYIGTRDGGDPAGNQKNGIIIRGASTDTVIGGLAPMNGNTITTPSNVISGNVEAGILIEGGGVISPEGLKVMGNYIGVEANGKTPLSNAVGVKIVNSWKTVTIGGIEAGASNVISGNSGSGIECQDSRKLLIAKNYIGFASDRTTPAGNGGLAMKIDGKCRDNDTGGNYEGHNGKGGVRIEIGNPTDIGLILRMNGRANASKSP